MMMRRAHGESRRNGRGRRADLRLRREARSRAPWPGGARPLKVEQCHCQACDSRLGEAAAEPYVTVPGDPPPFLPCPSLSFSCGRAGSRGGANVRRSILYHLIFDAHHTPAMQWCRACPRTSQDLSSNFWRRRVFPIPRPPPEEGAGEYIYIYPVHPPPPLFPPSCKC